MAQTGYTPISIYYSATATNVPTAGNLVAGELAINTNDGKLFYKDSSGVVQTIASKAGNLNVSSFSGGTTGLTPNTATTGAVTLAGTLAVANGGTGVTTSTGSVNNVLSTSPTLTTPIISTTLGVGGATPSASGSGITFPATQSASSDANTLDDYEEGTWTPSIGGTAVYTTQDGRYTKIGNFVKLRFLLAVSVKGTGSATTITGMPFAPSANSPTITGGVVCYASGLAVSANILGVYCQNSANIYFFTRDGAGTGATTQQPAVIGNSFAAYCEISYMID